MRFLAQTAQENSFSVRRRIAIISSISSFVAMNWGARMPASPVNLTCRPSQNRRFWTSGPRAPGLLPGLRSNPAIQAVAADIGNDVHILQGVGRVLEVVDQRGALLEQLAVLIERLGRDAGGAGRRMGGIGVAVEKLDRAVRCCIDHRVVDFVLHRHGAHRLAAVGQRLGQGHDVRRDAVGLGGEGRAEPADAGDDFVEHQQDAVGVADFAQPLQIALRRDEHAGRPGDRLDKTGGDGMAAIGIGEALQIVGELFAILRLAAGKSVFGAPSVAHVDDIRHADRENVPVLHHAGERDAAHVDAVIGALARHENAGAGDRRGRRDRPCRFSGPYRPIPSRNW